MTHLDALRLRLERYNRDQFGILPLLALLPGLLRRPGAQAPGAAPQPAPGAPPPQAAYPPPRRPLPPPPDRLIPVLSQVLQALPPHDQQDEDITAMEYDIKTGQDGNEYACDRRTGHPMFRLRRPEQAPDVSGYGFGGAPAVYGAEGDDGMAGDDLGDDPDIEVDVSDLSGDLTDDETGEEYYGLDVGQTEGKIEELKSKAGMYSDRINKIQNARGIVVAREKRIAKLQGKLGKVRSSIAKLQRAIKDEKAKVARQRKQAADQLKAINGNGNGGGGARRQAPAAGTLGFGRGAIQSTRQITAAQGDAIRREAASQGVRFSSRGSPGSGRMLPVSMLAAGSTTNRVSITIAVANTVTGTATLTSEDVPYSLYMVCGFTANIRRTVANAATAIQAESGAMYCTSLAVKGSPNLFIGDALQDAEEYDTDHEHLLGLRDYPEIASPNRVSVSVSAIASAVDVVLIGTFNVVVDQINDSTYGNGVPGPYAT